MGVSIILNSWYGSKGFYVPFLYIYAIMLAVNFDVVEITSLCGITVY